MKVLLIDDEKYVHISTSSNLSICHKIEVASAFNGQEGLDWLANNPAPDAIILDMKMPVMGGEEFLRQYKGTVPIIVSSGYQEGELPPSVVAVIPKPYACSELAETIKRFCEERREAHQE